MKESILKLAIAVANMSEYKQKIGVVIFKNNKIISTGYNQIRYCGKISPKYKLYKESLHAEQDAILNAPRRLLKGASILVVRINRFGEMKLAKPCPMCEAYIRHSKIKNVYYTIDGNSIMMEKIR